MTKSFQNKRALLLGNGINLLNTQHSFSWSKLLEVLQNQHGIDVDLKNVFKPFPLAFEEMLYKKEGGNAFKEKLKVLKVAIKESMQNSLNDNNKVRYNKYHRQIFEVGYSDILTTNYDYALQYSVLPNFDNIKKDLAQNKQERKFSLKRCYKVPDFKTKIWHIHGELSDSRNLSEGSIYYHEESIMIGYEHYSSYLEKIQENLHGKQGVNKPDSQSLMTRIKNGVSGNFWTDIFFTHDIDIVGQGFDFSENHLWWLIHQRASYIRSKSQKHSVKINNKINFYYPVMIEKKEESELDDLILQVNTINKMKAVADILEAFHVNIVPIECKSYIDFYDKLLFDNKVLFNNKNIDF